MVNEERHEKVVLLEVKIKEYLQKVSSPPFFDNKNILILILICLICLL
jgi:hypothetical protein